MARLDSTPPHARPFLGDAPRRARTAGAAGETLRREAVATLSASLARPGRLVRQVVALAAASTGLSLATAGILPPAGAAAGSPGMIVAVGLVLLLAGAALGAGPVVEGVRTTRALQAWLAPGAGGRGSDPSLTALLRSVGVVRLVGCGLLVPGIVAGALAGLGVLGEAGIAGTAGPAALMGTLPAVVTVVLAVAGTLRLERGRRGRAPHEDDAVVAAAFAPGSDGGVAPGATGWHTPTARPVAEPAAPPPPPRSDVPSRAPVAAPPTAAPAVVTGVPVLGRPAPLAPGGAHPLPVTTTEPGPVPGRPAPSAPPPSGADLPEATIVRADLPEHTVARGDLLRPRRLVVVLDDGAAPVALTPGSWLLGRAPSARAGEHDLLPIVVEDRSVSKTHLLVEVAEGTVSVTDRASSNGTHLRWAGGRRRLTAWQPTAVAAGESVELGTVTIRVETAAEASA